MLDPSSRAGAFGGVRDFLTEDFIFMSFDDFDVLHAIDVSEAVPGVPVLAAAWLLGVGLIFLFATRRRVAV